MLDQQSITLSAPATTAPELAVSEPVDARRNLETAQQLLAEREVAAV